MRGSRELLGFSLAVALPVVAAGTLADGLGVGGAAAGLVIFAATVAFTAARDPAPVPLGAANRITLGRLALLAGLAGHALSASFSSEARLALAGGIACVAYAAAAIGDFADGAVARRSGAASAFGARLDPEADAVGVAAASGLAVLAFGTLPVWYLAVGFGRYLFGAGLAVERGLSRCMDRRRGRRPDHGRGRRFAALEPGPFRRRLAGFQMGLLAVCLVPGIEARWALPSAFALGAPCLAGFVRDYLVATGRLDPRGRRWRRLESRLGRLRSPVSRAAALSAAALGAAKLAGAPTGAYALAAFFFAWLLIPEPTRRRAAPPDAGGGLQ